MARVKVKDYTNIAYDDEKKLYYVTMDYGKNPDGKRVKKTKTYSKLSDAKRALKEFEADKTKNNLVFPDDITLENWLNDWLKMKSINCDETTLYGYKNIINNHLIPALGEYKLQVITPSMLNNYFIGKLNEEFKPNKKYSKNTVRKHYDLLLDVFKSAVDKEKILKNPVIKAEKITVKKNEQNVYTKAELKALLKIVEGNRMEIVIKLAGVFGLRREEIAGLRWRNVDFENQIISIVEARTQAGSKTIIKYTKNESSFRKLSLPDDIMQLLKKIRNEQEERKKLLGIDYKDTDYVIAWENGVPFRPNYLSDLFKKVIDDNKLKPLRLHDLRHTFASICNQEGITMYNISKALGHSQQNTTSNIYTHLFDKTHEHAVNKVADAVLEKSN